MGLTRSRHKARASSAPTVESHASSELDDLIGYGHAALVARGAAPLALQLDFALRLAGLHLRRAADAGNGEDGRWAVTLASFVVERGRSMPPAALLDLVSRAVAVLELSTEYVASDETERVRSLVEEAREHLRRAEALFASALDDALASYAIGNAMLTHAEKTRQEHLVRRAGELLATAVITGRAVGEFALADAARGRLRDVRTEPESTSKRRGRKHR